MSYQEPLDYYCPMCWERELPYAECRCGLHWNAQRRKMPHYAIKTTGSHAEKQRYKLSKKYRRTAFRVEHKGELLLVEPGHPGSKTGPVRLTRRFETHADLVKYCEEFRIEILMDGNQYLKMPETFRASVFFDRVRHNED